MRLKELVNKYGNCEVKDGFLDYLKEIKTKTIWELEEHDEYFCIGKFGLFYDTWMGSELDIFARSVGNCFLTEEDAVKEQERRKIQAKLEKMTGGYEFTLEKENWYLVYDTDDETVGITCALYLRIANTVYFPRRELAEEAIDKIGEERLIRDYFQVIE